MLCNGEEDGLVSADVLVQGNAGLGGVYVSFSIVVCGIPFVGTRYEQLI